MPASPKATPSAAVIFHFSMTLLLWFSACRSFELRSIVTWGHSPNANRPPPWGRSNTPRGLSARSGLQRGQIGRGVEEVVRAQLGDDGSHQRAPGASAVAVLHVIELPRDIARRAAGERRHGA